MREFIAHVRMYPSTIQSFVHVQAKAEMLLLKPKLSEPSLSVFFHLAAGFAKILESLQWYQDVRLFVTSLVSCVSSNQPGSMWINFHKFFPFQIFQAMLHYAIWVSGFRCQRLPPCLGFGSTRCTRCRSQTPQTPGVLARFGRKRV